MSIHLCILLPCLDFQINSTIKMCRALTVNFRFGTKVYSFISLIFCLNNESIPDNICKNKSFHTDHA